MNLCNYYLEIIPDRDHKYLLHEDSCEHMPAAGEKIYLGQFAHVYYALEKAREENRSVHPCPICCKKNYMKHKIQL